MEAVPCTRDLDSFLWDIEQGQLTGQSGCPEVGLTKLCCSLRKLSSGKATLFCTSSITCKNLLQV